MRYETIDKIKVVAYNALVEILWCHEIFRTRILQNRSYWYKFMWKSKSLLCKALKKLKKFNFACSVKVDHDFRGYWERGNLKILQSNLRKFSPSRIYIRDLISKYVEGVIHFDPPSCNRVIVAWTGSIYPDLTNIS